MCIRFVEITFGEISWCRNGFHREVVVSTLFHLSGLYDKFTYFEGAISYFNEKFNRAT